MYLIYDLEVKGSLNVDMTANKPSKWHEIAIISVRDFALTGVMKKLSPAPSFLAQSPQFFDTTLEMVVPPYPTIG